MKLGKILIELGRKITRRKNTKATSDGEYVCWWILGEPKKPKIFD